MGNNNSKCLEVKVSYLTHAEDDFNEFTALYNNYIVQALKTLLLQKNRDIYGLQNRLLVKVFQRYIFYKKNESSASNPDPDKKVVKSVFKFAKKFLQLRSLYLYKNFEMKQSINSDSINVDAITQVINTYTNNQKITTKDADVDAFIQQCVLTFMCIV